MDYRKEIDGLRSIAVVPVIFFHAGFSLVSGGYVGVDVFFVISGYLITSLLIADLDAGRFSIAHFYERRIRRIIPALLFMVLLTTPFAAWYMIPDQVKDFYGSLLSVATFVSNFFFAADAGYFGAAPLEKPLLHTWSLSVEEQYYVLFPLLLMAGWRAGRTVVARWIAAIAVASLLCAELGHRLLDPELAYFLTTGRAWELLLGSLLAFHGDELSRSASRWLREFAAAAGLVMIGIGVFAFDQRTPSPGLWMLLPTLGAALVLAFARHDTVAGRLLAARPLVAVGLVSYSAYLWHQPILAIARIGGLFEPDSWLFASLALASIAMGGLSYLLVERPFRRKDRFSRRTIFAFGAGSLLLILAIGVAGLTWQPAAHPSLLRNWKKKQMESYALFVRNPELAQTLSNFGDERGRRVLVIGDSHAKDMFNALYLYRDQYAGKLAFRYANYSPRCLQSFAATGAASAGCDLGRAYPALYREADTILFSARWNAELARAVGSFIDYHQSQGKRVVITGRTVEFPHAPSVLHRLFWDNGMQPPAAERIGEAFWDSRMPEVAPINDTLRSEAARHHATYLDKWDYACEVERHRCFALDEEGHPLHYDYGHYTVEGAKFMGQRIVELRWLRKLEGR